MQHIPCSRHVLINLCCKSSDLDDLQQRQFRSFAEILSAYLHYKSQKNLEVMKHAYSYFNPNQDTPVFPKIDQQEKVQQANILVETFCRVLTNANYIKIGEEEIQKSFSYSSLVPVNTSVNLDEYENITMFYRGSTQKTVKIKKFFRNREINFDNYDYVAVLLHIKNSEYFENEEKKQELNFSPGKIYLYLYRNIPHFDLELLFPNVKISMSMKDKLMLIVPALGAAIPMVIKVLPALGLVIGVIAFVVFGWDLGGVFDIDVSEPKAVYPLLVAALSACVALGGYAFRQYVKYKSKRLEFLKKVTDVLFFKSLDVSQGVLNSIIDLAEEEECKEMLLIYFVLLEEKKPLTKEQLVEKLNRWTETQFSSKVKINVARALENLNLLQIPSTSAEGENSTIVKLDPAGVYSASSIDSAKQIVDYVWDNVFQYSNGKHV